MQITPNKLSIAQLLATNNEQFVVPSYQRRYAWGYNQVKALFDDIRMLKEGDGHLFGMIILHTEFHTGGLNKPELVDGQQRLTSLAILLKVIQNYFNNIGNKDKKDQIKKMLVCSGYDEKELPKLELGELDNADFIHVMNQNGTYEYTNKNIRDAYTNFTQWLEQLKPEEITRFFYNLINVAVIIRLDVGMPQDAYKLFENINNRGLRLSATDIIKNFLLGHAAKIGTDVLEETKSLWSAVITNLDNIDSDDFFRQYMCSLLNRKVSKSKLVYEFKKYYFKCVDKTDLLGEFAYYVEEPVEEDDVENNTPNEEQNEFLEGSKISIIDLLKKLTNTSNVYRRIVLEHFDSAKITRHISYLNNILSTPTYIFLMHFLQRDLPENTVVEVLKIIESFMLRRHICEMRTSEHDDIFAKMLTIVDSEEIIDKVKKHLKEHFPTDEAFRTNFPEHKFKGRLIDRAKYVLEQIEYFEQGNVGELIVAGSPEVHLEHIIPQTINTKKSKEEFGDWEEYLGPNSIARHKKYVDLIGNMTLLAGNLNIQAYNNPFAKKKNSYKKSSLAITKKLTNQSDFKFHHIEKRGKELVEKAIKIWKI
jgi:uncharacterized protein with ParB-like and HNH nuclease domain